MAARSRYWCFTEHTYPQALAPILFLEGLPPGITYLCGQLERGEQHDKTHFQGYVELEAHQRVTWLKRNLSHTAHFEVRRGTQEEAIGYTQKEDTSIRGTWVEFGTPAQGNQGKRNDLLEVKALLDEGASIKDIAERHFGSWVRYEKSFIAYKRMIAKPRDSAQAVEVVIYYGPTGTGKSRRAREDYPDNYDKPPCSQWFDGYAGEDAILFDEYRGSWMPFGLLLRLTDRHRCSAPIKGGHVEITSTKMIFTTNVHPRYWYKGEYWEAFARRITTFWIVEGLDQDPYQDPHPFVTVLPHEQPHNAVPGYAWN